MKTTTFKLPTPKQQRLLEQLQVRPLRKEEIARANRLLDKHHYLHALKPVGERMYYAAVSPTGGWLAILVLSGAAKHLRARDTWIGWTVEQRRRRLSLVVNNARFLILPRKGFANLGTRVLKLTLARLAADWQSHYGHPVVLVETFVDPQWYTGTVYRAGGWEELGSTRGWGRCAREYYERHNRPKRLWVRELMKHARRSLQAEHLKPGLAMVEAKVRPRCTLNYRELRALVAEFKSVPDYRRWIGRYPLWSLLAIVALASMCGAGRGQKDIALFAQGLTKSQRRILGVRRNAAREYSAPSQPTFSRLLAQVKGEEVEAAILRFQERVRGPAPQTDIVAVDGKEARRSRGVQILTAVAAGSLHYLGSLPVSDKTNEIPVARELFKKVDVCGRLVGLDALHTQTETAQDLVLEHGGDYVFTVKGNQGGLKRRLQKVLPADPAGFSPTAQDGTRGVESGAEQGARRVSGAGVKPRDVRTSVFSVCGAGGAPESTRQRTQTRNGLAPDEPPSGTVLGNAVADQSPPVLGDRKRVASTVGCQHGGGCLPRADAECGVGVRHVPAAGRQPVHRVAGARSPAEMDNHDGFLRRDAPRESAARIPADHIEKT
jgi:hypothetical protein